MGFHHRHYQQRLIDIGSNDMTLFGEIDRLADDIVTPVFNLGDESPFACSLWRRSDDNPVAHSHRVCAPDATQSEVAFDFTINS